MSDPNTGNTDGQQMNSLPSVVVTEYTSDLTFWRGEVIRLQTLMTSLTTSTLTEYDIRSGDGMNKGKRHDPEKIMRLITNARNQVRWFESKLSGRGVMDMALRRKP